MKAIRKEVEKIRGSIELNGSYDISENMVIGKAGRIKDECYESGNPEDYEELLAKLIKIDDNKIILVMSRPIINEYIVIEESSLIKKHILMEIEDQIREELEENETF